ncbi:outer membrane lipoprotein chaperone LolA [Parathalassolituus penaei]|uniref:Outer-membrane lipoprotein carrier protein n=1 Tax=Parathalassolituus penaei TaxID=2997323 RepID=A0A9X3EES8_9GAMM|nr:outer membrane lipoprotein chaperone LolA [Parathalassolituus penaei]MCY0965380.1 outer membrane lipoprotein chaperone LolA [Parathalassolituus penaei]
MKYKAFLILLLASCQALAQNTALDNFVSRIRGVTNLQGDFTQTVKDAGGRVIQTTKGLMLVATPGKLRWETQPPFQQLVVSDGKDLWVYDRDLEQVTVRELDQDVQGTPALLLSGRAGDIENNFQVGEAEVGFTQVFHLVARDKSQLFESLDFVYEGKRLVRMRIHDTTGQSTEIAFSNVLVNELIGDHLFQFEAPEGVDVIDARATAK